MKLNIIYVMLVIMITSCTKQQCGFYQNNDSIEYIQRIIANNPQQFFNNSNIPKSYFTNKYKDRYANMDEDFKKRLSERDFNSLKNYFSQLSIDEILFFNSDNMLFKVGQNEGYLNTHVYYLGFLKNIKEQDLAKYYEVEDFRNCNGNWYSATVIHSLAQ
ncbi:hypothetical protein BCY89_18990 [Sphingobacterium siyangense]|uniref:Lipoprotein n=1 Tax=Sphingobacterium siyangense TaxID=459529 RepID=A0A420FDI8_9SPHI|nr:MULTISPECIES: hypothetical protein [Sphingobacterium]QQT29475.1 hypothetical protein I6I99_19315 [Sphingobacterium multivorum]QRY59681.1 hypothetical protein JVX97_09680 [Sphingobacterium siyangense]RKF31008.1 hypothetical protein BCY89_18990 [Sphingobacterium siyangense]